MPQIELGISGLSPGEYRSKNPLPPLSEVELPVLLTWPAAAKKGLSARLRDGHQLVGACASAWFFTSSEEPEPSPEKISILKELAESYRLRGILVRVHQRHLNHSFGSKLSVHLDFPMKQRMDLTHAVWDPLWDGISAFDTEDWIAKIHGWDPARWVRKYSLEQIRECAQRLTQCRSKKGILLLGHSQRREQWVEFHKSISMR